MCDKNIGMLGRYADKEFKLGSVLADEIEREIESRYLLLPVDSDGVPIKLGDDLEIVEHSKRIKCKSISVSERGWTVCGPDEWSNLYTTPLECRHVKPRTLENVLAEVENGELSIDGAAAEIRELLGVDA